MKKILCIQMGSIAKSDGFVCYGWIEFIITKSLKRSVQSGIKESFIPNAMSSAVPINQLRVKQQQLFS